MRFEKVTFDQWLNDICHRDTQAEKLFVRHLPYFVSGKKISECTGEEISVLKRIYDRIELPKRATKYSAAYDFINYIPFGISIGETICIPTGIKWNPCNRLDTFLSIYPRSSLGRDFMVREPNIVSIIDADYYGNITNEGHIFINLKNEGNAYFQCKDGMGYVQGIIQPYLKVDDDNVETIRTGGFGSTTKQKEDKQNG